MSDEQEFRHRIHAAVVNIECALIFIGLVLIACCANLCSIAGKVAR